MIGIVETTRMALTARRVAIAIEDVTGIRPTITLACGGYADEHWQIWSVALCGGYADEHWQLWSVAPVRGEFPDIVVDPTGIIAHPDGEAVPGGRREHLMQRILDRLA